MTRQDQTDLHRKQLPIVTISQHIALLAWTVSLVSLVIFMLVTVPWQKKIFSDNMASKANGLAVSLHDVAAGAAVNEDYTSVVNAAQTLLEGDPGLAFLIVMKNDGYALVVEHDSWRVQQLTDSHFLKKDRHPSWEIGTRHLFFRRVFHFAQPFDYSGIQWGWIHVGLSLEKYDSAVSTLYKKTGVLALACIFVSFIISIIYARHMVNPILELQTLFHQIAQGDLSVRTKMKRNDELGSLADSANIMADALLQRNQILESVRFAAYCFLQDQSWKEDIVKVLQRTGKAADTSRALVHKLIMSESGVLCVEKSYEWHASGICPEKIGPDSKQSCFEYHGLKNWAEMIANKKVLARSVDECSDAERVALRYNEIQSIIIVPVFMENRLWGTLVLEDCTKQRNWTTAEINCFRALADMLGATIARQRFQEALLDAKNHLEEQVNQRTSELREQVEAKQKALSDLSDAQGSLVEMSRTAGMAEVATGVLHNVGNVLNSVNVSATLLMDYLQESRTGNVTRIAQMLDQSPGDLSKFLSQDPKGRQVPSYLASLGKALSDEHVRLFSEAKAIGGRIEHIKEIVAMQQSYGRVSGVSESVAPDQLMEDALMLNEKGLIRHKIVVKKEYEKLPPITVDKHKVLQILLNFIHNAKYACSSSDTPGKIITLKIACSGQGSTLAMSVMDNGIGIQAENLTRIFQHGFTTRKSGHGFGLHSGALAAQELGGRLLVESDGPGQGAVFTLELPLSYQERI